MKIDLHVHDGRGGQDPALKEALRLILHKLERIESQGVRLMGAADDLKALVEELNETTNQTALVAANINGDTDRLIALVTANSDSIPPAVAEEIKARLVATKENSANLKKFLEDLAAKPDAVVPEPVEPAPEPPVA